MDTSTRRQALSRLLAAFGLATAAAPAGCQPEGYGTVKAPPAGKSPFSPRAVARTPTSRRGAAPKSSRSAAEGGRIGPFNNHSRQFSAPSGGKR